MPQSLRDQALQALEEFIRSNLQAERSPAVQRMHRNLLADPTDATAERVLRNLGIPYEAPAEVTPPAVTPPAVTPPTARVPPPPPTWEPGRPYAPPAVEPPVQMPAPLVEEPPPAPEIAPQRAGTSWGLGGVPSGPGPEIVQTPWKVITGGIPALQRGADWAATRIDPTVQPRPGTAGDVWEDLGGLQRATRWKAEPEYAEGTSPWFDPVRRGEMPPPDWGPQYADYDPDDPIGGGWDPRSPANTRRKMATGLQQLGDLFAPVDLFGGLGLLRPILTGLKNIRRGTQATDVAADVARAAQRATPEGLPLGAADAVPPGPGLAAGEVPEGLPAEALEAAYRARVKERFPRGHIERLEALARQGDPTATRELQQIWREVAAELGGQPTPVPSRAAPVAEEAAEAVPTAAIDDAVPTAPVETPAAAAATPATDFAMPQGLARSNPRYSGGVEIAWNSDLDKALYIVRNRTRLSKSDAKFMDVLRKHFPGESDDAIRARGDAILERVKAGEQLDDGRIGYAPEAAAPTPSPAPVAAAVREAPPPLAPAVDDVVPSVPETPRPVPEAPAPTIDPEALRLYGGMDDATLIRMRNARRPMEFVDGKRVPPSKADQETIDAIDAVLASRKGAPPPAPTAAPARVVAETPTVAPAPDAPKPLDVPTAEAPVVPKVRKAPEPEPGVPAEAREGWPTDLTPTPRQPFISREFVRAPEGAAPEVVAEVAALKARFEALAPQGVKSVRAQLRQLWELAGEATPEGDAALLQVDAIVKNAETGLGEVPRVGLARGTGPVEPAVGELAIGSSPEQFEVVLRNALKQADEAFDASVAPRFAAAGDEIGHRLAQIAEELENLPAHPEFYQPGPGMASGAETPLQQARRALQEEQTTLLELKAEREAGVARRAREGQGLGYDVVELPSAANVGAKGSKMGRMGQPAAPVVASKLAKAGEDDVVLSPQLVSLFNKLFGGRSTPGGASAQVQERVKWGDETANRLVAALEHFPSLLSTAGKQDGAILKGARKAFEMIDSGTKRVTLHVIDQAKTVGDQLNDFVELVDALGKHPLKAPGRRVAPMTPTGLSGADVAGIPQRGPAIKAPTQLAKEHRLLGPATREADPDGWSMADRIAEYHLLNTRKGPIAGSEKAHHSIGALVHPQKAAMDPGHAQELVHYLKTSDDPDVRSLWTQYTNLTYHHLKALELNAVAAHLAKRIDDPGMSELFARQAQILNDLYQGSFSDINRWANAIADVQRTPTRMTPKGAARVTDFRSLQEIELPRLPEAGAPTAFLHRGQRGWSGGKLHGQARPPLPRGVKRHYDPIDVSKGEHLPQFEAMTPRNVILQQAKFLQVVDAQSRLVSETGMAHTMVMLHLGSSALGTAGGGLGGKQYAEAQGWGPAATTGAVISGAIGGGIVGGAVPSAMIQVARKGISLPAKVDAFLMNSLLSSPRSWVKAWEGAHNGAMIASLERSSRGLLDMGWALATGDDALLKAGRESWDNGRGLMKDILKEDLRFFSGSPNSIIRRIYGIDLTTKEGWAQAEDLLPLLRDQSVADVLHADRVDGHVSNALIGKLMRSPDWGFQKLMQDRGFGFEEARRYTLTGTLRTKLGQRTLDALRPAREVGETVFKQADEPQQTALFPPSRAPYEVSETGVRERPIKWPERLRDRGGDVVIGTGRTAGNLARRGISPVPRVQIQAAEMGGERTVGPLLRGLEGLTGKKLLPKAFEMTPSEAITRGVGTAAAAGAGAYAQEHLDPRLAGMSIAAMGPYAIPFIAGAGAKQAFMSGGSPLEGMVGSALDEGIPIDLERPLGDLKTLPGIASTVTRLFTPSMLRDIAGAFDPTAEGRVTSSAQLERAMLDGRIDMQSPTGQVLGWVRKNHPTLLGAVAELATASPFATDLPEKPLASLNRFGQRAFDPQTSPFKIFPEPGGWQDLPPSAEGIAQFRPPEAEAAWWQQLIQGGEADPSAWGAAKALGKNALLQTFFPTYQAMKPADLPNINTPMGEVLQALQDYGSEDPLTFPMQAQTARPTTSLTLQEEGGRPLTGVVRRQQEEIVQAGAGERNRRVYEFVKMLMDSGVWGQYSPIERFQMIEQFKAGGFSDAPPVGPGGSATMQRRLAHLNQARR